MVIITSLLILALLAVTSFSTGSYYLNYVVDKHLPYQAYLTDCNNHFQTLMADHGQKQKVLSELQYINGTCADVLDLGIVHKLATSSFLKAPVP